jgi:Holliday junction resolvase RusA-like endonuclease
MTEFFMPMIPPTVTAQEHKVTVIKGNPVFYDTVEIKNAKEKLISNLYKFQIMGKYRNAVRLTVKWCFPDNSGRHRDGEYRDTKPDTDNLNKMLKDCMTLVGFWTDDALVASEICEKFWVTSSPCGIYIKIEEL